MLAMHTIPAPRSLSLVLLSILIPASRSPGEAVDLRLVPRTDDPVLVDVRLELNLEMEIVAGKKRSKAPFEHLSEVEFVDEFTALDQPAAGDFDARRSYLKWEETSQDEREDNEMTGVRVRVTRRAGTLSAELDGRMARKSELERVIDHAESLSWFELPAEARPEEPFLVEPESLVRVLLDVDGDVTSSKAQLELASVDDAGLATLTGTLLAAVRQREAESGQATFQGTCTVVVDTRAHRLSSADWKGQASLSLAGGEVTTNGKGTFAAQLSFSNGAAAREALARKVVYRDVPRTLDQAPVGFELPSHWFERELAGEAAGSELFSTSLHGDDFMVSLEFRVFALEGDSADSTIDAALATLDEQYDLHEQKPVSCPLGKGRSVRFRLDDAELGKVESLLELYPCGRDRLLRVQLLGKGDGFDVERKAWSKVQKTLKLRG